MNLRVEICGINTGELPSLTDIRAKELMLQIKSGDEFARKEFIMSNLRLVLSVIQRFYRQRGDNIDDVFQVGCIGLIKAIDNFNVALNVKFSTYAVPMIIGEIRRYLRDNSSLKVTRSIRDIAYKALVTKERLEREQEKEVTIEQVANELGINALKITNALDAISEPMSIFEPVFNQSGDAIMLLDQLSDDKINSNNWTERVALQDAVEKLSDKERKILYLRYYAGKTQVEVSEDVGISQAQVSRLEKSALKRMKTHI